MTRRYIDLRQGNLRVWLDEDGTIGHSELPHAANRPAIVREIRSRLNLLQRQETVCKRFLEAAKYGRWQRMDRRL